MKVDYLGLKREVVPLVLLGASAVFGVLILARIAGFFAGSVRAEGLVKKAADQSRLNHEQIEDAVAKSCAVADELKKSNLFSPPEARQHPVTSVLGILGDEVLIGDKWYKAGEMVQDARVVAVEPTQVRIEWDGREKIFTPLEATEQSGSEKSGRTSRSPRLLARADSPSSKPPKVVRTERAGASVKVPKAQTDDKSRQRPEKQRPVAEKKEPRNAPKGDVKKPQPEKKKKDSEKASRAKEKVAEKRAKKLPGR